MSLALERQRRPTEERQAAIVDAVLAQVAERGPAAVTTTDIARALNLTQGAVFKHFPTKDAIWMAVMDWVEAHLLGALEAAEAGAGSPLDGLRAVFMAHVRFVMAHPGVPRLIFHELQQADDTPVKQRVRGILGRYRALIARLLDAADAEGALAPGLDKAATAMLFIGSVQGLVMQSMLSGGARRMADEGERVFALVLRGIAREQERERT